MKSIFEHISMRYFAIFSVAFIFSACTPKEQVVLKSVENLELVPGKGIDPILKGDAIFYNPNRMRMKLKEIEVDVFVDGIKSARVDQQLNTTIKSQADFTIPIEVQLSLEELGVLNTLLSLIGGKKYEIQYTGHVKVSSKGIPFNIPFNYKRTVKL